MFLNGYDIGGSHLTYHQVFYADTSLTKWAGGLQNYGASYTFFQYLWEQAGGNGDGTYTPDLEYDGAGGDLLIKLIFENQADSIEGVQAAIDEFNAQTGGDLRDVDELFQDWAVAVYLDDEGSDLWDIKAADFGDPAFTTWTMDIADDVFWSGAGDKGAQPASKWRSATMRRARSRCRTASRSSGSATPARLCASLSTARTPRRSHRTPATTHWYAGYESQSDNILDVDVAGTVTSLDFWTWHFIEEGWDYGVRRGARGRRVGHRASRRRLRHDGDDRRRPARQQP